MNPRQSESRVISVGLCSAAFTSAKGEVLSQTGFTRLFVLRAHVPAGVSQGLDGSVQIDAMP
jgi:hypothetical protein